METTGPFKHLYRSRTDRVFAGIFGGLGEYWNIDPVILRVLWVLVTIFTGFVPGVVTYIIAIFVIPEAPLGTPMGPAAEETRAV